MRYKSNAALQFGLNCLHVEDKPVMPYNVVFIGISVYF